MNVTKQFPGTEIYLATNIINEDDLYFLQRYHGGFLNKEFHRENMLKILNKLTDKIKLALLEAFPYLDNPTFKVKEYMTLLPGETLRVHHDGVPGSVDDQPTNVASVFYINDNFGGGETFYPTLGVSYKPVAGHVLMHPGYPGYEHGVSEVLDRDRHSITVFGYNNYNGSIDF